MLQGHVPGGKPDEQQRGGQQAERLPERQRGKPARINREHYQPGAVRFAIRNPTRGGEFDCVVAGVNRGSFVYPFLQTPFRQRQSPDDRGLRLKSQTT